MEFTEYAAKYSETANKSRNSLSESALVILFDIQNELLEDPFKYPDRVIAASRDGNSFVYSHPDPLIQITFEVDQEKKVIYFFHYSAPALKVQKTLFISYSHEDEKWLTTIRKFLVVLEQEGLIRFWDDSQLEAGKPWNEQILGALDTATAGVLLVSQKFLSSDYINNTELPKLLDAVEKKGKKLYWIHISPSTVFDTHEAITRFQSLQKDPMTSLEELKESDRKRALVEISRTLSEAVRPH